MTLEQKLLLAIQSGRITLDQFLLFSSVLGEPIGMEYNGKFLRTFRVSRLYFRYIHGSKLEARFTDKSLAAWLEDQGMIRLSEDRLRYAELEKFKAHNTREALHSYIEKMVGV